MMKPQVGDTKKAFEFFKDKITFTTGPAELKHWIEDRENINIVDVRRAQDFEQGHIEGAVNLPQEKWNSLEGLKKDKVNVVYCYTQECHLAPSAAFEFTQKGYFCVELEGGFDAWKQ